MVIFDTAEGAHEFVARTRIVESSFELAIADGCTFAGQVDVIGAGMALVLNAILAQGYEPDGFAQCEGFRLYRYKPIQP